jgi:hypothetical protein
MTFIREKGCLFRKSGNGSRQVLPQGISKKIMAVFKTAYISEGQEITPPEDSFVAFDLKFTNRFCRSNKSIEQMGDVLNECNTIVETTRGFPAYFAWAASTRGVTGKLTDNPFLNHVDFGRQEFVEEEHDGGVLNTAFLANFYLKCFGLDNVTNCDVDRQDILESSSNPNHGCCHLFIFRMDILKPIGHQESTWPAVEVISSLTFQLFPSDNLIADTNQTVQAYVRWMATSDKTSTSDPYSYELSSTGHSSILCRMA